MTDWQTREEKAFAEALEKDAASTGFAPLDLSAHLRAAPPPRRRVTWQRWLPAAAALVIAVPLAVVVLNQVPTGVSSGVSATPAPRTATVPFSGTSGTSDTEDHSGPTPSAGPGDGGPGGPALPGFRYTSMLDVVVQVPAEWGYNFSLQSDWCVGEKFPGYPLPPFVDMTPIGRSVAAIACPTDEPPEAVQSTHLTWKRRAAGDVATTQTKSGFLYISRPVGSAMLTMVVRPDETELAEQVFATAEVVKHDHNGCTAVTPPSKAVVASRAGAKPVQDYPGPVELQAQLAQPMRAEGLTLCQYEHAKPGVAALVASTHTDGSAATDMLRRVTSATGRAPTWDPKSCYGFDYTAQVVLRFDTASGPRERWLSLNSCGGLAVTDGHSANAVSGDLCRSVFQPPLYIGIFFGDQIKVCGPR